MDINETVKECWQTAEDHGWHNPPKTFGEDIALIHSELSEALEEYRNGEIVITHIDHSDGKPIGIAIELADAIIRIFDLCKEHDIDITKALRIKMDYNKTRSYRHGNKKL